MEKALLKEAAQYYKDVIAKTFLISEGKSIYYKDDVFDKAPINRLVLAMVPEKNFTGDYRTPRSETLNSGALKLGERAHLWGQRQLMRTPAISGLIS